MRWFPALDIDWPAPPDPADVDRVLAALDDHAPTAIEDRAAGVRVFFGSRSQRECALHRFQACDREIRCVPVDVPDEDWAERSQSALHSVVIDRIIVSPPWDVVERADHQTIVIQPSMGFGTGHHASTRLCLALLQSLDIRNLRVLDVGTGSGVLAIAAAALGAAHVTAIDHDDDAIAAARENVERNRVTGTVGLRAADLVSLGGARFDVVLANLTGALLMREAARLTGSLSPAGSLIVSGIEVHEAATVLEALATSGLEVVDRRDEDGWTGARLAH